MVRFVRKVRLRQPRVGTRKLHYLLQGQDDCWLKVGRDRLFQILAEHRCWCRPGGHITRPPRFYRHPDLLKAGPSQATPVAPEQVWVADITYLCRPGADRGVQYCSGLYQELHERPVDTLRNHRRCQRHCPHQKDGDCWSRTCPLSNSFTL